MTPPMPVAFLIVITLVSLITFSIAFSLLENGNATVSYIHYISSDLRTVIYLYQTELPRMRPTLGQNRPSPSDHGASISECFVPTQHCVFRVKYRCN
jgi:hypothetical protein